MTTHDRYPLHSILDLSNKLHGCKFFSCIDLVKGYHQILMAAQDVTKTVIITPFSLFVYLFMPFRLRNKAQTFQRFMDSLFKHLPFVPATWTTSLSPATLWRSITSISSRSSPSFRRTAYRSTRRSACSPPSPWSSWDTGWTSTASGRSSGTYRPFVIFLPLRM